MCYPPIIAHSTSFESVSSYSPSSSSCSTSKRNHMGRGMISKSMSNSLDKDEKDHHFLDSCSLCKTKLYLEDDIYMYKGDVPFCSEECRHGQIEIEERNEKTKSKMGLKKAIKSNKVDDVYVRAATAPPPPPPPVFV